MKFRFTIKSETKYLSFLRQLVAAFGRELGWDKKAIMCVTLALVEAVDNAIFHAHQRDAAKDIEITLAATNGKIELSVTDVGPGFVLKEIEMPPLDRDHGRGLFLLSALMNQVAYQRGKNKNTLRLTYLLESF